jgi:hypothetical protein
MGAIFNQNSYYIPASSKRISVLFGSFVTKSLLCRVTRSVVPRCDDPVHTRWVHHQSRIPCANPNNHNPKKQQGHRVISEHSAEIVPRWVLHHTRMPCAHQMGTPSIQILHHPNTTLIHLQITPPLKPLPQINIPRFFIGKRYIQRQMPMA